MAYQEVSNLAIKFHTPENTGKSIEGFIVGTRTIKSSKDDVKPYKIHDFIAPDGMPFSLYGFTIMDNILSGIPLKRLVKITYLGKTDTKTKYGGIGYHKATIQHDSDVPFPEFDSVELPAPAADPF